MSVVVKNIHIPIQNRDYNFNTSEDENSLFIGREQARKKLKRRIEPNGALYRGAYLVAGYRGIGKSTLVNKVIAELNKNEFKKSEILPVSIFLSQGKLSDYELLRQIFIQFTDAIKDDTVKKSFSVFRTITAPFILLIPLYFYFNHEFESISTFLKNSNLLAVLIFTILFILLYVLWYRFTLYIANKLFKRRNTLSTKIDEVYKRINSDLETQNQPTESNAFTGFFAGSPILNKTISILQQPDSIPYKQSFNKYTAKELEFEIMKILSLYKKFREKKSKKKYILFVIDELDKLEPEFVEGSTDYFDLGKSRMDTRKETLLRLMANLKSFIHTAEAKFIFIGGAEMYDASLADIADRESFYSSIFNEVIYVNSFFKDFENRKTGVTQMVENYLIRTILGNNTIDRIRNNQTRCNKDDCNQPDDCNDVNDYLKLFYCTLIHVKERDLIFQQIHKLIVYLTYRSNGSPKKLKELIENYLLISDHTMTEEEDLILERKYNEDHFKDLEKKNYDINHITNYDTLYLTIRYKEQHKIGLLSSMFFPYLIENQNYLKDLNDKNLYLSAFLMDHILKFHKSAFSWRELELMPDIIIGNKGPNLRETLKNLIAYLSDFHIRETTNAMFQFKFRSRSAMELKYISKISDESAAAFNFTLDESYHIKAFFKRKLKQKMEMYRDNASIYKDTSFIHTLGYLNSTIADIHFYDEDFDSAIRYYADAVQQLRDKDDLNQHQMILYTRNRLLLSLCLEKTNRYDSVYSILRSITIDTAEWEFGSYAMQYNAQVWSYKEWEEPYKRMQLFLRPHLALLMIIEKDRSDGITESNLDRNIKEYAEFMGIRDLFPFAPFDDSLGYRDFFKDHLAGDHKRVQTLLAEYYQSIGSLLFYKNRNFKSLYEKGCKGILKDFFKIRRLSEGEMKHRTIILYGEELTKKEMINYMSLDNVRTLFREKDAKHYYPSFSAFFYYITSVGHLLSPYLENLNSIFQEDEKFKNLTHHMQIGILEKLIFENRSKHILNGKQKQFLALVISKLSDSILSCLGRINITRDDFKNKLKSQKREALELQDLNATSWGLSMNTTSIAFDSFFSINTVLYFNVLSYRLNYQAGKYYDALFCLKKSLYIVNTHLAGLKGKKKSRVSFFFIENFITYLSTEYNKVLKNYSSAEKEKSSYHELLNKNNNAIDLIPDDQQEKHILMESIYMHLNSFDPVFNPMFLNHSIEVKEPTIQSIFSRIQFLKHHSYKQYTNQKRFLVYLNGMPEGTIENNRLSKERIHKLEKSFNDINFCFKNLNNIIKTYEHNYIMSYSYMASLYYNLILWSEVITKLKDIKPFKRIYQEWKFKNTKLLKNEAVKYYKKSIRLHSEGNEYKSMIKEMYLLEDDLNDSLVHFCAALERSLINTGVIEIKLNKLYEM